MIQIDRIRLTAVAKNQLITLKRKTGINHYNTLCRYAFCLSLANEAIPPIENLNFNGGIDIDWRTFTGGNEVLYLNLLLLRGKQDGIAFDEELSKKILYNHIHRGLSYLVSMSDTELHQMITLRCAS
ncbi:DNA sulfur modification protein DndE [Chromobacterium subtsugae]|uniref:DNA sulfur modification protein DndE n=1 Tax=Chromobacterium subtsugae TaxID=251747 RepID=A0ABS7F882_9NEIS|nr:MULTISPECIES: DNA sulfur modification protein DndE [Chromobacterium]MBW7565178.1 DNA sulfur modification protein DndE [Chromobacterium subtsugae]MBW8286294.1 DNA sulfur modification protein DndE [Chromobacterium subtsugae]WSE91658.1 DNA sulfur modification protein DndE [Chromobacterium subtsugae]WVH60033.1 DNA sulfur modification protein DndE [Chromobacterium subtsugae]